ncbi:MAG: hypothetical protein AAF623_13890 [Planctomycetota bacterium]
MEKKNNNLLLSPELVSLLDHLRSRIRRVILFEGLGWIFCALAVGFWVTFALDYIPVQFAFDELSINARLVLLLLTGLGLTFLLSWFILRKIFVPLPDFSMAILVEKRYPEFNDALLTTIDHFQATQIFSNTEIGLLKRSHDRAVKLASGVDLSKIISSKPARNAMTASVICFLSIILFFVAQPQTATTAVMRIFSLSKNRWPRATQLRMVGIRILRDSIVEGVSDWDVFLKPAKDSIFKVASGSRLTLTVDADCRPESNFRLPEKCWLNYWSKNSRGTVRCKKIGSVVNGKQRYSVDGQPFSSVIESFEFEIYGGDHRIGPYQIEIANTPMITSTQLFCQFPDYLQDKESLKWSDRKIEWTGQATLPAGTKVNVECFSNKPVQCFYSSINGEPVEQHFVSSEKSFTFSLPQLFSPVELRILIKDDDNILPNIPHTIQIDPVQDIPPNLSVRLEGIGNVITPMAQIPISGTVADDYRIKRTWAEIEISGRKPFELDVDLLNRRRSVAEHDFFVRPEMDLQNPNLVPNAGNTVSISIQSSDYYDLGTQPNIGSSDTYLFEVVSPDQLLRILEQEEVGQRRRLEQVYSELNQIKKLIQRRISDGTQDIGSSRWLEPGEKSDSDVTAVSKSTDFELLLIQRASMQCEKSLNEIVGSKKAFQDYYLQLINNRVDTQDRLERLSIQIINPLELIGTQSLADFKNQISELERDLRDVQNVRQSNLSLSSKIEPALDSLDQTLNSLNQVIEVLIKYETQNELLDIVRRMIDRQTELLEKTKIERQESAFDGLLDLKNP